MALEGERKMEEWEYCKSSWQVLTVVKGKRKDIKGVEGDADRKGVG